MSSSHDTTPPMNHVFVDFENVPKIDLSLIGNKSIHLTILLGPKQTKLATDLVEKLMEHASSVKMIRLESSGKNALDFTIAYYVGRTTSAHPGSYIHIVSRDTGFDPLVEHLKKRHVRIRRHDSFDTLTFSHNAAAPKGEAPKPDDALLRVVAHLKKNAKNRPKKKKTLLGTIQSQLGKDTAEAKAEEVLATLCKEKRLSIGNNESVEYHF